MGSRTTPWTPYSTLHHRNPIHIVLWNPIQHCSMDTLYTLLNGHHTQHCSIDTVFITAPWILDTFSVTLTPHSYVGLHRKNPGTHHDPNLYRIQSLCKGINTRCLGNVIFSLAVSDCSGPISCAMKHAFVSAPPPHPPDLPVELIVDV
jgi:hypothetical protein